MKTSCGRLVLLIFLLSILLKAEGASNKLPVACNVENAQDSISSEQSAIGVALASPPVTEHLPDKPDNNSAAYDWKQNGLFKALFHLGMNFAQIDGDAYAGYNKIGFDGGAGVLLRFHKYFSTSIELDYTQWGARASLLPGYNKYNANLNYIQVPLAINVHDKEIIMFSAGLNFGFLVGYKERNEIDSIISNTVQPQPKLFDLDAFAELNVIIKKQFCIGAKFSYSMLPFRGVEPQYTKLTSIHGEYNNVVTLRFMYILGAIKKKPH